MTDWVNHPPHYTKGKIEVLDFIQDQQFGYLAGQVVRYISRYQHKGAPLQDLQKAKFYLERLIEEQMVLDKLEYDKKQPACEIGASGCECPACFQFRKYQREVLVGMGDK